MKFVIDSDVFIEAARPKGAARVRRWFFSLPPLARIVCPVTLGEFLAGADFVSRRQRLRERRLASRALKWDWHSLDEGVAEIWAALQRAASGGGLSIGDNDCWLAALALKRNARLATGNTRHFKPLIECQAVPQDFLVNPFSE